MKRLHIWTITILAAALSAGCGTGSDTPRRGGPIGGESGTELAERQVLRWGNGAEPQGIDPHRSEGVPSSNIQRDLFEGLTSEAPNGDVIPGVAERWQISEDGKTYVFSLRENARWSNGDPLTAHDFVYSLRRTLDPATESRYGFILFAIVNAEEIAAGRLPPEELGVRALDDYTLEVELVNPAPYFPGVLTHSASYPVHRGNVEQHGERFTRPGNLVSNGAYQLADWVMQSHLRLTRNPHYWDNERTVIDEVYFYNTEDLSAEVRRYRADELDITYNQLPRAQLDWMRANLGDELVVGPYLGTYYYGFNVTRPPFEGNLSLRKALTLAIDRETIAGSIMNAGEIPSFGWVPAVEGYTPQQMPEAEWTQDEREEEARRLYQEAGYSRERPLRVEILYNTHEDHRRIAVAVAAMWRDVLGVQTEILNQEWRVFLDTRHARRDTQVYRAGWIGDYNDAYTFLELNLANSELNHSGWSNAEYDRLLRVASSQVDPERRAEYLQQAERLLLEELPVMPIYYYSSARLVKPWVDGFESNIMEHHRSQNFRILKH
jgi:oligopeptide transport system substrate-binding protein